PRAPQKPRSRMEGITDGLHMGALAHYDPDYLPKVPLLDPPGNVSGLSIKRTNSINVDVSVRRLKHHRQVKLSPMYVVFSWDDPIRSFGIEYRINAGNIPKEAVGTLHVVFSPA